jgi:predicted TIM-barrel fold metal-dependent hydrolase
MKSARCAGRCFYCKDVFVKIVDGQIHAWPANTPETPWPDGAVSLHGPEYTIEETLAQIDAGGVDRAVLVPPSWIGFDNSYSLRAAQALPDRLKVMGRFDPQAADAKDTLKHFRRQDGMLGLRAVFRGDVWLPILRDQEGDWFWETCQDAAIPLMCLLNPIVKEIGPRAERYPRLQIIVDHAGRDPQGPKDEASWADIDDLLGLAKFPNVCVKVSSLPSFSTQPYPFPNLHKPLKQIYDAFGPKRMIWGSDVTRLRSTYEENISLFTKAIGFFSAEDLEWIMGRTLAERCDWPL